MKIRKQYQVDDNTFGDSKAEVTLARILTQRSDFTLNSYVTKTLGLLSQHCKNIAVVNEDIPTKRLLFESIRDYYYNKIDLSPTMMHHEEVRSYLKNAIMKRLRATFTRKILIKTNRKVGL